MAQLTDLLTTNLGAMVVLALFIFGVTIFVMRRRLVHIVEPALIQMFLLSFGFAGLYLLYTPGNYSWFAVVLGAILGIAPFVLFYRRSFITDPAIIEKRDRLANSTEFRIFLVASCAAIIAEALITIVGSGFTVVSKEAPALLIRQGGILSYFSQAGVSFVPAFLLLSYRTKLFSLVIGTIVMYFMAATVAASRASFLWPALVTGAAFFLRKLDRNTAEGWPETTIISFKNALVGVMGIASAFGLLWLAGYLLTDSPTRFLFTFLLRLFDSLDGLFMAVQFSFITPHAAPEYSVFLAYTQPIHKLLHLNVGQMYNNIGEYVAVHVYHLNIWSNPDLRLLSLPNSNLVLEFELSYGLITALVLIPLYATALVRLLNWSEKRRYDSIGLFCLSQYLVMNSLQYFLDGNYFVLGAYSAIVLLLVAKIGGFLVDGFHWKSSKSQLEIR